MFALRFVRALTVLALLTLVITWLATLILEPQATLAQRIDPHSPELAKALGEPGTPIGSPQRLLIFDAQAYLPGASADGARLVSERYLSENQLYPLQWKTVTFVRDLITIAASSGAVLLGLTWWWLARRRSAT